VCALLRGVPWGNRSRNGTSAGAPAVREELGARNAGVVYQERKATRGYAVLVTSAGSTTGADRRVLAGTARLALDGSRENHCVYPFVTARRQLVTEKLDSPTG